MATGTNTDGGSRFNLDPAHGQVDVYGKDFGGLVVGAHNIALEIWNSKYRWGDEESPQDSMRRVVEGVYAKDDNKEAKRAALEAMYKLLWIPAGRIQAGAGTQNVVTLLNCYVSGDIEDSMSGIADALKGGMLTMQQGGGDGFNFSTLRPSGAHLSRTGAVASGPMPFMDMWDSMCQTIMSAGSRRGAMMGVMDCEHPDLVKFITAKHEPGRLTNFNVSVLVTDAFLDAITHDEDWYLGSTVPRHDGKHLFVTEQDNDDGSISFWYAYERWSARELWDLIIENTYEWSEPGVIFIDRINEWNNLRYCETIIATNPCGEQPLPAHGCCNLGAVNLARMVRAPFTDDATFDYSLLTQIAEVGTRFLDNVIDVTLYPLEEQAKEEFAKRRIGVGITGLANALDQLGIAYGSRQAVKTTEHIMQTLLNAVYSASAQLAQERGVFPLYDAEQWGVGSPVQQYLSDQVKADIKQHGVRNGVMLTIAPTGTTSLYAGNVSSGLEPVFQHRAQRNVRQTDDSFKPYTVYDYGWLLHKAISDGAPLPEHMLQHHDLSVEEHIAMQAACQRYVDSSVSKTINCSKDMPFDRFKEVYLMAYRSGCKGCTTYRPSDVRGSILVGESASKESVKANAMTLKRPEVLSGATYKVQWPGIDDSYYVTINDVGGKPFEVFIHSTSSKYTDWTTALSLMISAIMRQVDDISFVPEELKKVRSADNVGFVDGKFYGSLVSLFGDIIGRHLSGGDISEVEEAHSLGSRDTQRPSISIIPTGIMGETCPKCNQPAVHKIEGCERCIQCDWTKCY